MKRLNFIIAGQSMQKDPDCDFSGLVRGSAGYLYASFCADREWDGCQKIAVFRRYEKEIPVRVTDAPCEIPEEVLDGKSFRVHLIGLRPGYRIRTNEVEVEQL